MQTKIITVSDGDRDRVQRADIERSARRDIIIYLMEQGDNIQISPERRAEYQKEYDEKYFEFEQAKAYIEREYVMPAVNNKAVNWSLDYATCEVTITYDE